MKTKFLYILIPVLVAISCTSVKKKDEVKNITPEITLQTIASFKSAEHIYGDDWKLIFRRLDDCQYILVYTDIRKINAFRDSLIIHSENAFITNPDFVNLRFSLNYIEESAPDPVTGENVVINRLLNLNRAPGDRFAVAGFDDDIKADDFVIKLKQYTRNGSVKEISEMISYPLTVNVKKKRIKISTPQSFIKDYDTIFNDRVKKAILSQAIADIKASSKGLSIGSGEIWINSISGKIFITSVNN